MMIRTKKFSFLIFLFLIGCAAQPTTLVSTRVVEKDILSIERPSSIRLERVQTILLTGRYMVDLLEKEGVIQQSEAANIRNRTENLDNVGAYVAFTIVDFEKIYRNFLELERYILQQKEVINYYENVIK